MLANLITEVSLEQPAVVVIGSQNILTAEVSGIFSKKQIPVINLTVDQAVEKLQQKNLEIYKIIWIHHPDQPVSQDQINRLSKIINQYRCPVIQVFPIITPIKGLKIDQKEFEIWLKMSKFQEAQILSLNSALNEAQFVFLQDLVMEQRREPINAIHFCTNSSKHGLVFDPEINFYPMLVAECVGRLEENLLRPDINNSVLIRGKSQFSTTLLKQIQQKYQGHHQVLLQLKMSPVEEMDLLPFSVLAYEVDVDNFNLVSVLTRLLHHPAPQPEPEKFPEIAAPAAVVPVAIAPPLATQQPPVYMTDPPADAVQEGARFSRPAAAISEIKPDSPRESMVLERKKPTVSSQDNNFDVSLELQRIFDTARTEKKVDRIAKTAKKQTKIKKKSKRRTGLFYGGIGVIGIGIGVLVLAAAFFATQFFVKRQVAAALKETMEMNFLSDKTQSDLERYNSILATQLDIYGGIFDSVLLVDAVSLSELGKELSEVTENLKQTRENTILYTSTVLGKDVGNGNEYAQKLAHSAQQAYENLSLIQARIEQIELPISEEESKVVIEQFSEQLQKLRHVLNIEQQLHPYLSVIFGQENRRTYALVLQNDQEIRPTGGFIEAIALLRFENGSLISTDVYSSYELDEKLIGVVSPPEEIKQFLSEDQWYLRDSNWDPSFPATAKKIAWFIEKTEGTKIDGVLALNTKSLAALIEALGPVDIVQFNETLTHRNLAERMEFHSEVVLVESSETDYYPKVVLTNVLNKLTNIQPEKVTTVLNAFYQQFQDHQMTVAIFDDSQDILAALGWTGEIVNPACPTPISSGNCVVDELAQVEANVGVNKANYYLKRSINHTIRIGESRAEHTRLIQYENTAQSNAWPKGSYRAYIRFYMPHGSQLKQIKFGDEIVALEQLIQREEGGRPMVGVLIEVPTQQSKNLEVVYTTPIPDQKDFSYAFFDQKQSGIDNQSQVITLIPSEGQHPKIIAPQADFTANGIVFSQFSGGHGFIGTKFE